MGGLETDILTHPFHALSVTDRFLLGHAGVVSGLGGMLLAFGAQGPLPTLLYLYGPSLGLVWVVHYVSTS